MMLPRNDLSKGLIFVGEDKSLLLDNCLSQVSSCLSLPKEKVLQHPDVLLIEKATGNASMGVDVAERILCFAKERPLMGEKRYILIKDAETLTVEAQNKLLKLLEEEEHAVSIWFTKNSAALLPTVKSRMEQVTFAPLTKGAFFGACDEVPSDEDKLLLYLLTNGYLSLVEECNEQLPLLRSVRKAFVEEKRKDLLSLLHLVKEKDESVFFKSHRGYVGALYRLFMVELQEKYSAILNAHYEGKYTTKKIEISLALLESHLAACQRENYSLEEFFLLIASM